MAMLIVDDREQAVSPFLGGKNVPFMIKRITTGDFCIVRTNPADPSEDRILAIFERKTLNDFAASIKDGRYENYSKMVDMQKDNAGCQLYYIIESQRVFIPPEEKFDRIPYAHISAAINKLEVIYNIQLIRTKDPDDTSYKLKEKLHAYDKYWADIQMRYPATISKKPIWPYELVYVMKIALSHPDASVEVIKGVAPQEYKLADQAIKQHIPTSTIDYYIYILQNRDSHPHATKVIQALADANKQWEEYQPNKIMDNLTESHHKSPDEIKLRMWMEIPGVSWAIAPELKRKFTLKQFINQEISQLSLESINYISGKKLHNSVVKTLTTGSNEELEIKILQCIPGIGQKADALIKNGRLKELIKYSEKQLAEIKTGKTHLGPVKAAEILSAIN